MREGLLSGIGFLSAFLSGAEIGFFRSLFSKRRQSRESCVVHAPPCLWRGRRVSRHELSGTVVSTRSLRTYFIAVRRFLVARSDGCFGSFLGLSTGVPPFLRRADWSCHVYGHVSDSLDQPRKGGWSASRAVRDLPPTARFTVAQLA